MAHGVPFRRTAWLLNWWESFQSNGDLFVLQVTDSQGAVVGVAPWYIDYSLRQGRVIRPLGSGDTCSDYLGILTTTEHEQHVLAALTEWLVAAAAGQHGPENRWDLLDLVSVDAEDQTMLHFFDQLESSRNHVYRCDAPSCWRIELPGSWDDYLSMLGRSQRKRVRRMDRKWLLGGVAQLRTVTAADELPDAMQILIDLHQRRQASLGRPGCFADPAFTQFLTSAARDLLREQILRLHWMEMDGKPFAAEFQLTAGDSTYAYLGGMSDEMEEGSPGQIIQVAILKQCIQERQQVFDFLRGDETYKSHWGVREQKCCDYRVVPHRHTAQLRHQAWVAGGAMKQWIRTGLQITGIH